MSHLLSHLFRSHHSRCDTALPLFASKCLGECYAGMAALCDLGLWGSPVSALSFVASFTLLYGPLCFPDCLYFASFSGHTHDDTQDAIVHLISQSW